MTSMTRICLNENNFLIFVCKCCDYQHGILILVTFFPQVYRPHKWLLVSYRDSSHTLQQLPGVPRSTQATHAQSDNHHLVCPGSLRHADRVVSLAVLYSFLLHGARTRVVPYQWCQAMNFCVQYIPTIFHTASIWLTVALATQRYICVCHVFKAKTWCTTQKTLTTIAFIFLFATLSHSTRFFEVDAVKTTKVSMLDPNITVSACSLKMRPWVKANINLYFNIYFWFRVIFIHLIPCVSLAVMTALLVHTMRMAERRRRELQLQNEQAECRRLRDSNRTTLMLVIVVVTFLLVELPLGLLMVLHILRQTFYLSIIRSDILSVSL